MYWGPSRQNSSIKISFTSPLSEPKKIKKNKNIIQYHPRNV